MVSIETTGTSKTGAPAAEEVSQLRVIRDYFRSMLLKYFESIGTQKWLIIEPSLF
jgi:hypothetical protein